MKKIYLDIKYGSNKHTKGHILDISKNGIGIASCMNFRKNIAIKIIIKKETPLSLKGKVISCVDREKGDYNYRLGVKFVSLDKIKKLELDKFIYNLIYLKRKKRKKSFTFI